MRRGLISWSRAELPEALLEARVRALQAAMARERVDAAAIYTTPARTAGVSWLTGFVPYWNEGLLVVPAEGRPELVSALSNRVRDWIERNAHLGGLHHNPRVGAEAGRLIGEGKRAARVAAVDLAHLPATLIEGLASAGHKVVDGTELLAAARAPADAAEIALTGRAAAIAERALAAVSPVEKDAAAALAVVDGEARRLGAEEVLPGLACDLDKSTALVRLEGTARLGARWALRVSLAYKGHWVRMTRALARDGSAGEAADAAIARFAAAVCELPRTDAIATLAPWSIEGCRTTLPLEALAGSMIEAPAALAAGMIVSVQAVVRDGAAAIPLAAPVLVGSAPGRSSLLAAPRW